MQNGSDDSNPSSNATPVASERRRHRRSVMKLGVRFLLQDGSEHTGNVTDISVGGMYVKSDATPAEGTIVIAYIQDLGRLEGMVSRLDGAGFGVRLTLSTLRRDKLEERLSNERKANTAQGRRHERDLTAGVTRIVRGDGSEIPCRVMDLSLSGVSVETTEWPALGEEVMVGKMRGRVIRHHEVGFSVEFTDVPPSRGSLSERLTASSRSAA
jgi:PilZ domain